MTKVFITIPWFLPAFRAGGPIQSIANLVNEFREDIEYYIFCGDTDLTGGALENITTGEWLPFNEHTQVWYADHEKISDSLVKQVETIKPDVLYIIGIFSWHFNIVPIIFCKVPKKILSVRGMLHPGALSQKKWKKKIYLQLFRLFEYHYKVQLHATDTAEENYIRAQFGYPAVVNIAGNFPNNIGALPVAKKDPGVLTLISIALLGPIKNILLVLQALEKMDAGIRYHIYGPVIDIAYWEECRQKISMLPSNISVVVHKEIEPSGVKEALQDAHVFILPSKSENFGHAIYEALSAGRPVITSNFTPWNQLQEARAGRNVGVEDLTELKEAIRSFAAMDEATFVQWQQGAMDYAVAAIDIEKIRAQYREMFLSSPSPLGEGRGEAFERLNNKPINQ
ncbi:glycosyltransferase [Ginsengibacter hankyongi]|uniref:Glycosyltransferase n=1 Tax=Ginsengibacter hankyongi TaxID=2607284 RepID=A0A5J5IC88_9BACT|nr:glycosyltransferase [Ginsengibacter hankyongi]KAA9034607.1 glycosyltransferase [Ginsengibacter hankyongi]